MTEREKPVNGHSTYFLPNGRPMSMNDFWSHISVFQTPDPSSLTEQQVNDRAEAYANRYGVDNRGINTGKPLNLAMGENRGQHARKTWTNNFNNGDEQVRRGMLIPGFRPQGYDSEDYAGWQADMRANYGQQPQWNATDYLANSSVGGVLGQDIRQRNQGIQGWNNWNANADALMQQQAREKAEFAERWRQADIDAANHWEDKMFKEYGKGVSGLTREQWDSNPELRRQAIDTVRNDRRTARNNAVVQSYKDNNGDLSKMDDYQAYADNMERIHGKAWDARGFTPEQRERFIKKDYMYNLQRRGIKSEDLIITPGVNTRTAQTAPAQPVAPQKIEQDITPEENTTADVDIESKPGGSYILPAAPKSFEGVPIFDGGFYPQEEGEESIAQTPKKDGIEVKASANIMSILFPQRARDIVKEYF